VSSDNQDLPLVSLLPFVPRLVIVVVLIIVLAVVVVVMMVLVHLLSNGWFCCGVEV